jgi:cation diffusion facilitator family transporter
MIDGFRKALLLEYFTVGYNFLEALASILFGYMAGSPALVGFGMDSVVESLSGMVLIWRLRKHGSADDEEERIERRAQMFVGITFLVLALYIFYESVSKLYLGERPETSIPGIAIAIASLMVMPLLAISKVRVARRIGSKALIADAKETIVCALLSVALLIGLTLNLLFGMWWADPVAGFFIVIFLVKEGVEGIRGEEE